MAADAHADTSTAPATVMIGNLRRENAKLVNALHQLQTEHSHLKRCLYHSTSVLDRATALLDAHGIPFEIPPFDVRAISKDATATSSWNATASPETAPESSRVPRFELQCELREHTKSIVCAAFAPGQQDVIASGSLDKKVVLHNVASRTRMLQIDAHASSITDLAWLNPSSFVSSGCDGVVKTWTMSGASTHTHTVPEGFVVSLTGVDEHTYACSDTRSHFYIVDTRGKHAVFKHRHSHRVTALAWDKPWRLITGGANGVVTVWDIRSGALPDDTMEIESSSVPRPPSLGSLAEGSLAWSCQLGSEWLNEASGSAIAHLSVSRGRDESRRLLVVADDDMARVYRGRQAESTAVTDRRRALVDYSVHNVLTGLRSRTFLVRGAFWRGSVRSVDDDDVDSDRVRALNEGDLVVIGSGTSGATVFDVTSESSNEPLQVLSGHKDRVLGGVFHPSTNQPILATFSADTTLRVWAPARTS